MHKQLVEAVTLMIAGGLRSSVVKDAASVANYVKAALLIAQYRGCESYLVEAANNWLLESHQWLPTAAELCDEAVALKAANRHTTAVEVVGTDGQKCYAIMTVKPEIWRNATEEQKELATKSWCQQKGFTLAPPSLPTRQVSEKAKEMMEEMGFKQE